MLLSCIAGFLHCLVFTGIKITSMFFDGFCFGGTDQVLTRDIECGAGEVQKNDAYIMLDHQPS